MLLRLLVASLLTLAATLAQGCSSGLPKHLEGDLYTQCRMVAVDEVLFAHPVTDKPGTVWAPGAKVRIKGFNAKALILESAEGGTYYLWAELNQAWNLQNLPVWAAKFVDPAPPKVPPALAADVQKGSARPGMWREEVVFTMGWPTRIGVSGPAANLSRDTLNAESIWRINTLSKGERYRAVTFEGNKVVKVDE